jgi:hypothetical protein
MSNPYLFGKDADIMGLLGKIFDISTGHRHDGADSRYVPGRALVVANQALTTSGTAAAGIFDTVVSVPTIEATDVVHCQLRSSATLAAYITYVTVTAGTGFTVYTSAATRATLSYAVFKVT